MKRMGAFSFFLAILSVITGYLLSRPSMIGRAGISLFYQQYQFLKVWWQGTLIVFIVWMAFLLAQTTLQKKTNRPSANVVHILALMMALAGLYFTYYDFRHTLSHHLLGERFHLGAYLFWIGWMLISLYCLVQKKNVNDHITSVE